MFQSTLNCIEWKSSKTLVQNTHEAEGSSDSSSDVEIIEEIPKKLHPIVTVEKGVIKQEVITESAALSSFQADQTLDAIEVTVHPQAKEEGLYKSQAETDSDDIMSVSDCS